MTATLTAPAPRELRQWQREAVDAVHAEWAAGNTRTAIVAATGLGKSSVIAKLAVDEAQAGGRVLLVAHREELLGQMRATCALFDPAIRVGWVQGGRNTTTAPITVAMVQTIARPRRRQRLPRPTLVIVDECHRAASDSYLDVLRWAGCFDQTAPTRLVGVTATFARGDKRGLGDVFQSVALERGIMFGIEAGFLVRPHGRVVVGEHLDLDNARTSRGDYVDTQLGEMVAQDVERIVEAWVEHARLPDGRPRRTVAFVPTVASAAALVEAFLAVGVAAEAVTGKTPTAARQAMYARLRTGVTQVLVNVFVLVEGWDEPSVSCVLMARPTKLPVVYQQAIGRGLRLSPETGKTDCLVLDVVGATRSQTLATLAELVPGAEVDTVEQDLVPCQVCDGYTTRKPSSVKAAQAAGMAPCSCPCPECGLALLSCACGAGMGRDPDGGRRRLRGRAAYAEVDLLGLTGDAPGGDLAWLSTQRGDVFCSVGRRFVVLHEGRGGAWSAASIAQTGPRDPEVISALMSLPSVMVQVEKWVEEQRATGVRVYGRRAPWRRKQEGPSEAQLGQARRLGIPDPEGMTKGALSDAIDVERASRQLAPRVRPASTWEEADERARSGRGW